MPGPAPLRKGLWEVSPVFGDHLLFWHCSDFALRPTGEAGFSFPGGGGSIEPSGRTPPSPKKGAIDRTPKILPSLTPRPWR